MFKTFKNFKRVNETIKNVEDENLTHSQEEAVECISDVFDREFNLRLQQTSLDAKRVAKYGNTWDFDVFLSSINMNLQREHLWDIEQKSKLIFSILRGIKIPPISILISEKNNESGRENKIYKVIDGKQRVSAYLDFLDNKFPLVFKDKERFFKDLHTKDKTKISIFTFDTLVAHDSEDERISDEDLVKWFDMLNYYGIAQTSDHIEERKRKLLDAKNKNL